MFYPCSFILFLVFAAIKRGPKDWLKIILLTLPFIIVPALLRGLPTGITDWKDYYKAFVAPFSNGKIDENIISLGMPALLKKLNTGNAEVGLMPIMHLQTSTLKLLIVILQVACLGQYRHGQMAVLMRIATVCRLPLLQYLLALVATVMMQHSQTKFLPTDLQIFSHRDSV